MTAKQSNCTLQNPFNMTQCLKSIWKYTHNEQKVLSQYNKELLILKITLSALECSSPLEDRSKIKRECFFMIGCDWFFSGTNTAIVSIDNPVLLNTGWRFTHVESNFLCPWKCPSSWWGATTPSNLRRFILITFPEYLCDIYSKCSSIVEHSLIRLLHTSQKWYTI